MPGGAEPARRGASASCSSRRGTLLQSARCTYRKQQERRSLRHSRRTCSSDAAPDSLHRHGTGRRGGLLRARRSSSPRHRCLLRLRRCRLHRPRRRLQILPIRLCPNLSRLHPRFQRYCQSPCWTRRRRRQESSRRRRRRGRRRETREPGGGRAAWKNRYTLHGFRSMRSRRGIRDPARRGPPRPAHLRQIRRPIDKRLFGPPVE